MRPLLSSASTFTATTVDKVERLLEVLAALRDDPLLGSVFLLHGGTALNVFSDELPRLSVDVDLMYVGQLEVSAMQAERPRVDARLRALVIRAISTADAFPAVQDPVEALSRFAAPTVELVESLRSVVAADDGPHFPAMCERVAALLAPCSALTGPEREYFRLLDEESRDRPQLLLAAWPDVLERALIDPVMQWKVSNLKKRAPGAHHGG